jgi:prepilin-type N-terminal cleavage/methylation domain-containing protein
MKTPEQKSAKTRKQKNKGRFKGFPFSCFRERRGFSLIESLVALTVLVASITGVLAVASRGLALTGVSRDKVVAFYLAQEPVEYIRSVRDSNKLYNLKQIAEGGSTIDWLDGLGACKLNFCQFDAASLTLSTCSSSDCDYLRFDGDFYGHGTGNETNFRRKVKIEEINPGVEAKIISTVSWSHGLVSQDFTIVEHIFNW